MTNPFYFLNGVRVVTLDPDREVEYRTAKHEKVVDYLTRIAPLLEGLWTVGIHNGNASIYYLMRDGGRERGGVTFNLYNAINFMEDKYTSRPDYWKFHVTGNYPQPSQTNYALRISGGPDLNVDITNAKRAAGAINRLIPALEEWTAKARENCAAVRNRQQAFEARILTAAQIMGYRNQPTISETMDEHSMSAYYCNNRGAGTVKIRRYSESVEFSANLTLGELAIVTEALRAYRTTQVTE